MNVQLDPTEGTDSFAVAVNVWSSRRPSTWLEASAVETSMTNEPSDVYALAATLFALVTGTPPYVVRTTSRTSR